MNTIAASTKLHLNKREQTFVVPLWITAAVAVISILISLLFWRAGSQPGTEPWIQGSQNNPGIAYALVSFLGYMGVQAVATTFPFALTLGATRKGFVTGTLLWSVLTSAYLTVILTLLTLLETATDHWFVGFYVFDVHVLGAGDLTRLLPVVFLGSLTVLTLGGLFGASWVRLGSRGPIVLGVGLLLIAAAALLILIPSAAQIIAGFQLWWLALTAVGIIGASWAGTWLLLRPAVVR